MECDFKQSVITLLVSIGVQLKYARDLRAKNNVEEVKILFLESYGDDNL